MRTFSILFSLFKLKWERPELKLRNRRGPKVFTLFSESQPFSHSRFISFLYANINSIPLWMNKKVGISLFSHFWDKNKGFCTVIGVQHSSPSRTMSWWRIKRHILLTDLASSQFNKTKHSACAKQEHSNDNLTHCSSYCWFARDVTAAMLVVKNKSTSLLWELNSIFM